MLRSRTSERKSKGSSIYCVKFPGVATSVFIVRIFWVWVEMSTAICNIVFMWRHRLILYFLHLNLFKRKKIYVYIHFLDYFRMVPDFFSLFNLKLYRYPYFRKLNGNNWNLAVDCGFSFVILNWKWIIPTHNL